MQRFTGLIGPGMDCWTCGRSYLFLQASEGVFIDVTRASGISPHARPVEARWVDYGCGGLRRHGHYDQWNLGFDGWPRFGHLRGFHRGHGNGTMLNRFEGAATRRPLPTLQ